MNTGSYALYRAASTAPTRQPSVILSTSSRSFAQPSNIPRPGKLSKSEFRSNRSQKVDLRGRKWAGRQLTPFQNVLTLESSSIPCFEVLPDIRWRCFSSRANPTIVDHYEAPETLEGEPWASMSQDPKGKYDLKIHPGSRHYQGEAQNKELDPTEHLERSPILANVPSRERKVNRETSVKVMKRQKELQMRRNIRRDNVQWERILRLLVEYNPETDEEGHLSLKSQPVTVTPVRLLTDAWAPHQVMEPRQWTVASLQDCVWKIVNSRQKPTANIDKQDKARAETTLMNILFHREDVHYAVSWDALHTALKFIVKRRRIDMARQFIDEMHRIGFEPTVETYNIQIRGCAAEQNFGAFYHWLKTMIDRNVMPNEQTFLSLLLAAPTAEAKQVIARAMHRKGLIIAAALSKEEISAFTTFGFGSFIDEGGDALQYIDVLDDTLGHNWLSETAIAELIKELGQRDMIVEALLVLDQAFARLRTVSDRSTLHILLRDCVVYKHTNLAIWLYIYATQKWFRSHPDHIVLELLFKAAMSSRMYNLAKVTWQFAAIYGELKWWMRIRVMKSLQPRDTKVARPDSSGWSDSFGFVVCGVDKINESHPRVEAILTKERSKFQWNPENRPSFAKLLVEALVMDRQWQRNGLARKGITWKVANAIKIPLGPREAAQGRKKFKTAQETRG